ncbi:hypothetical protein EP7_001229 [Isosphaeraceae bacterium EP7]
MSPGEEIFAPNLPDEPQSMQFEVRVSGSICELRLNDAIAAALAKHPMSRARLVSGRFLARAPRWAIGRVGAEGVVCSEVIDNEEALNSLRDEFYSSLPDLRKAPAIRALLVHRLGGDSLLFNIHHSLMDGIGAIRWVNSVARAYAGRADPVPEVDPLSVRDLSAFVPECAPTTSVEVAPQTSSGIVSGVARVVDRDEPGFGIVHQVISAEQCDRFDPSVYGRDTTVNDLLLAGLHLTIERWNRVCGGDSHRISILVPVNLRPIEWSNEVASMVVIVDRNATTPNDRADHRALVAAVTSQMNRIRSGPGFSRFLGRPEWVRWLISNTILPMILYTPRVVPVSIKGPVDSMLFANMGRIDRKISGFGPGAGDLTEFWASPPVTMPMGLGMDAAFLRGRIHLALRYRRALFDRRAALQFLEIYLRSLTELAGAVDPDLPVRHDERSASDGPDSSRD